MKSFRKQKGLGMLIFLVVFALVGLLVMLLWNALLPTIIGVSSVSYLQSLGIIVLSRFLFGGLGHWGKPFMGWRQMDYSKKKEFFEMHDKFKGMSREKRIEFLRNRMNDIKNEEN